MTHSNLNPHILAWIESVENDTPFACEYQHLLVAYVRKCFETEDIYTDDKQLESYLSQAKYFPFEHLFPWEPFCIALHLCTYRKKDGRPRWPTLLLLLGRGAGKDGYIAFEAECLVSPYNPIPKYDVDICANAEEQAMRPVNDVIEALEDTRHRVKMKKHFYWTKEQVTGLKYGGTIKGRTSNPKSKDGMRSGMVAFNEIHQYTNYDIIKVFITGLGKKKHPRRLYATTNGDTRDGPLDDLLKKSEQILNGLIDGNGMLPFICRLDDKEEAHNPEMWVKANPSLPYNPDLMEEILLEYDEWVQNPQGNRDFMTKRMNLPQSAADTMVASYEDIKATNTPLPELVGRDCVCGVDYASITDFASVDLRFKFDGKKYDLKHSWLCLKSKDLERLNCPWREWAAAEYITLVDDVEINPDLIAEWIFEQAKKYNIKKIAIDNFRYALMAAALEKIGFDAKERKNVKLIRPSDIMGILPVIESDFVNRRMVWGDYPPLRWAANNTKVVVASKKIGSDTGNRYYAKIEAKSRKTDPFMAMVAAAVIENELDVRQSVIADLPVLTW